MTPYWLCLLIPVLCCLLAPRSRWSSLQCLIIGLSLTLFIGLRHEVGGDWFNYIPYIARADGLTFTELRSQLVDWGDPGYNLLNWLFAPYPWGIYAVNTISAAIFSAGLVIFCRAQPRPWLSLCAAIPYLVIVVAMGYSRQSVAIGIIMPGFLALERGRLTPFTLSVAFAASFHSTALVMLAFIVPAIPGKSLSTRIFRLIILSISGASLVYVFLSTKQCDL